ncbi:hypothetical protein [Mycolicibacterium conceptionense]|nr:hypothetical protein [Mycolicibacterium conceptionense]
MALHRKILWLGSASWAVVGAAAAADGTAWLAFLCLIAVGVGLYALAVTQ